MPEVDYQPQDDHCERREVEPVRPVVLERTQERSEEKKSHVNAQRGKGLLMHAGQAQSSRESTIGRLPKSRPKKSLESKLRLKYAEEARR